MERERQRETEGVGGRNLRDRRDPGDKPSLSQAQAEGSCPRIYTFKHRSAGATAAGGGNAGNARREHQAIFSVSEAAMVERWRRAQRRPTQMTEHGFAWK